MYCNLVVVCQTGHSATCCTPAERAAGSLAALTWPPAGNVSRSASTKRTPAFPGEAESLAVRGEACFVHVHARAVDVLGRARTRRREARSLHAGELLARVHLPRQLRAGLVLQVGVQCAAWLSASATGGGSGSSGSSSATAESSPAVLPLPTGTARPDSEQRTSSAPSRSGGGAGAPRRMSAICDRCSFALHTALEQGFAPGRLTGHDRQ